jgi:DNA-binding MarR family transcriptional regulator
MEQGAASPDRSRTTVEPQWLDERERAAWLALTGVLLKLPGVLDSQLQKDSGLSYFDYMVLAVLSEAPTRTMPMKDLAMLANGSLSRLSHVVSKLEARGWVCRSPQPEDRRVTVASLTEKGLAVVEAAAPGHVAAVRSYVFEALTARQVDQLKVIGVRVLDQVDPGGWRPDL